MYKLIWTERNLILVTILFSFSVSVYWEVYLIRVQNWSDVWFVNGMSLTWFLLLIRMKRDRLMLLWPISWVCQILQLKWLPLRSFCSFQILFRAKSVPNGAVPLTQEALQRGYHFILTKPFPSLFSPLAEIIRHIINYF